MYERYTDRARRAIVLAQEETRNTNAAFISVTHVLIGLLKEGEGIAAKVLEDLGVSVNAVREVQGSALTALRPSPGSPPFTQDTKRALEDALRESLQLRHSYVSTEHLLLGLIRRYNEVTDVLSDLGLTPDEVRSAVLAAIAPTPVTPVPETEDLAETPLPRPEDSGSTTMSNTFDIISLTKEPASTGDFTGPTRGQLAQDVLIIAALASMPDSYWHTDSRIRRALEVLGWAPNVAREWAYDQIP